MPVTPMFLSQILLAGRAKGMMAERLAVSEAKLMKLHHDEVIKNLVEIKMELAQSRFEALELQVTMAFWPSCPSRLCCGVRKPSSCSDSRVCKLCHASRAVIELANVCYEC